MIIPLLSGGGGGAVLGHAAAGGYSHFGVSKQGLPHPQWGLPQPPTTHEAAAAYPAAASQSWPGSLPKGRS